MIDLHVTRVGLEGPMTEIDVPQGDFQSGPCPICRTAADSILVAEVRAGEATSMESAYCVHCEHRYFRKMPSVAWLDRYYAREFDAGQTGLAKPRRTIKTALKKLPGVETAWWELSKSMRREQPGMRQIRAFLEGIIEANEGYYLPRPDIRKVLEIGCGYGGKLNLFKRLGYDTYGVEASRFRAQACRQLGLKVFDCPVTDLGPVREYGPYDFAYSVHVLEHIGDVSHHLAQLSALVRDRGMLYIQVPDLWLGETLFMQSHAAVHCHTFSLHSLAALMKRHGFTPIRIQADNNLHVLACKMPPCGAQPVWKNTAGHEQLLDCLSWVRAPDGCRYRIFFDHAHAEVRRIGNDELVYRRDPVFSIQETPYRHSVEFSLQERTESPSFPVRFIYDRSQPPVWIKRQ
ncbi:MAG TPA: class I SAM-dependent methyltransferase [Nitrospiraceae bacterium]|nr:class I SAM-dependent methyltransferase [Nitrospiraceae bacterium]